MTTNSELALGGLVGALGVGYGSVRRDQMSAFCLKRERRGVYLRFPREEPWGYWWLGEGRAPMPEGETRLQRAREGPGRSEGFDPRTPRFLLHPTHR